MKKLVYSLVWVAVFMLCLFGLNRFFQRGDANQKYGRFFLEEREYDVLFFGTSHIMDAVLPPVIWESSKLSSYNLGNPAETMEATEWTIRLALERHTPRVAVIDVAYIDRDQKTEGSETLSHLFYDAVPFSVEKVRAVRTLFPNGKFTAFLFPLIAYHTRWESLVTGQETPMTDCRPWLFGAELRCGRVEPTEFSRTQDVDLTDTLGKEALRRIVDYCKDRGVLPVLTAIPYPAELSRQRMMNSARILAEEFKISFFNLFDDEIVDFATDCFDSGSHLNPDGAVKVSCALSEKLSEFLAPRTHTEEEEAEWAEAVRMFREQWEKEWATETMLPQP